MLLTLWLLQNHRLQLLKLRLRLRLKQHLLALPRQPPQLLLLLRLLPLRLHH